MHPVTEAVYDFEKRQRLRHKIEGVEISRLVHHNIGANELVYVAEYDDHPESLAMRGQVLPDLGLQVVQFEYREPKRPHANFDYYVDVVRVSEQGDRWVVRDLYLDILVFEGKRAEIIDTDEYLAAVQENHLGAEEAAYALNTAHTLLNGLAQYGYSLRTWLKSAAGLEVAF